MISLIHFRQYRKGFKPKKQDHNELLKAVQAFKEKSNQIQKLLEKYEGDDLINSLLILFNRTLITSKIPTSREEMKMTSVYEKKGSKQELDKRRCLVIIDKIIKIFGENYKD